uniref:Uncharacterized protein n=1 Tax=Rhizophora mucronata TaxID=61149 RepID=A0A2P2QPA4_RHIMU
MLHGSRAPVNFQLVLAVPEIELLSIYASKAESFFSLLFFISAAHIIKPKTQKSENNSPIATLPAREARLL